MEVTADGIFLVSIPNGSIKSLIVKIASDEKSEVSIPNGSIKRSGDTLEIKNSTAFQFQTVRLKGRKRWARSMNARVSIPNGSIKSVNLDEENTPAARFNSKRFD